MEAAGGTKGDSNFPSHLATIRPIRTYVRLVRMYKWERWTQRRRSMNMPSSDQPIQPL